MTKISWATSTEMVTRHRDTERKAMMNETDCAEVGAAEGNAFMNRGNLCSASAWY